MLCISAAYAVARCSSVRLFVTFMYSVKTNLNNSDLRSIYKFHSLETYFTSNAIQRCRDQSDEFVTESKSKGLQSKKTVKPGLDVLRAE